MSRPEPLVLPEPVAPRMSVPKSRECLRACRRRAIVKIFPASERQTGRQRIEKELEGKRTRFASAAKIGGIIQACRQIIVNGKECAAHCQGPRNQRVDGNIRVFRLRKSIFKKNQQR